MRSDEPGGASGDGGSEDLDDIVAEYADRINAGDAVTPEDILAEHPELCGEILDQLLAFLSLRQPAAGAQALGAIGDYTLRRQVGRGGMGVVYEAWESSMDRRVALKVLPAAVAADNRSFLRFMREARIAGQLSHQNVVPVYGMGVKDQTAYYAMEFVEGETLAQILRRIEHAAPDAATDFGRKDGLRYFMTIAEVFAEVAEGLQHAHLKGIIHRDIKPSNLILDRAADPGRGARPGDSPGRLRILDFGLAHLEGQASLTASGDLVGTVLYMSPEQARRRRESIDARSDVYSLGATLYETLTSRPPFRGKDHQDTLSQIIAKEPVRPSELNPRVPRDLETATLKCLEKDPSDRYRTAEALAQDLRRLVRGDPIEARAHSPWERIARRIRRHRKRLAIACVLLVLLAAVAALLLKSLADERRRRLDEYAPAVSRAVQMVHFGRLTTLVGLERGRRFDPTGFFVGEEAPAGPDSPLEDAVETLARCARQVPQRPDAFYHRARALLLLERYDEALADLDRAVRADAEFVPAFVLRAAVLEKQGREREARRELEHAERAATSEWAKGLIAAYRAFEVLDWETAARALGRVLAQEADEIAKGGRERYVGSCAELHMTCGVAHFKRRAFTEAMVEFAVARDRWREALDPVLLLGEALFLKGEGDAAERIFEKFYQETKRKDEAAMAVSIRLFYLAENERGLRWAGRIGDAVVRTRTRMAHFFTAARSAEGVLEAQRLPAGLDDARFCGNLALLFGRQNEFEAMRSLAVRALDIEPRYGLMWHVRGLLSMAGGDLDAARDELERAVSCAEAVHTYLYLAEALFLGGDLQGAEARFQRVTALFSRWAFPAPRLHGAIGDQRISRNFGALLEHMGKPRKALDEYRKVLDLVPGERWTHERLASLIRRERSTEFWSAVDDWIAHASPGPLAPGASFDTKDLDPQWCATAALALLHNPASRDAGKALDYARLAVEKTEGKDAGLLASLAEVEEACGDVAAAVTALERAIALPEAGPCLAAALAASRRKVPPILATFGTLDALLGEGGVETLVPQAAEWAILRERGAPPEGLEWTRNDFDDRDWERGKSPLGYGLAYFYNTRLDDMPGGYTSLRVRKVFDVPDPGVFRALRLEVWADNGFVAYLNGREIGRARLEPPDDAKVFSFSPSDAEGSSRPPPYVVTVDASRLSAGTNCLAVRGVDYPASRRGFYLEALLVGDLKPDIGRAQGLLDELRREAGGEDARARILYVEGRRLELEGRFPEAAETFRELAVLKPDEPLAHLRLARALCAADRPDEAEQALRPALPRFPDRQDLWRLWHKIAALDLRLSPDDMLGRLSAAGPSRRVGAGRLEGCEADMLWLLGRLDADGAVRINCGGEERKDGAGAIWGRDRFFLGGWAGSNRFETTPEHDAPLYRAHRGFLDMGEVTGGYRIPLPPGEYRASFHFAERTFLYPGHRVFSVRVEGRMFLEDYEPVSAGFAQRDIKTWEGAIEDGFLDVTFVSRAGEPEVCAIAIERAARAPARH